MHARNLRRSAFRREATSRSLPWSLAVFPFGSQGAFPSALIIPMLMQEPSDASSQCFCFQQVAHGARVVEQFPLKLLGDAIPLHDDRCAEATQDMLLFGSHRIPNMLGFARQHIPIC